MDKKDLSGIYSVATVFGFIAIGIGGAIGETKRITKQILVIGVSLFVVCYGLFALSLGHKPLFYTGVIIFFIGFNLHEPNPRRRIREYPSESTLIPDRL